MDGQEIVKLENSLLIRQSNIITESRHGMSATEQNIMYMLISQLRDDDPADKRYSIHISEIGQLTNNKINYFHLKESSERLLKKLYSICINDVILQLAPLTAVKYKRGIIELEISDEIRPFFFALKNNHTTFQFQLAFKLKSKYAKRIYEKLSQFKSTGIFRTSVQDLSESLELFDPKTGKETYPHFADFAREVLKIAKKEINEQTDISFEYITKKTGRKITDLEFKIRSKGKAKELVESTQVDPQVAELKERLVTKFQLSKTLVKKVLETVPPQEIKKILHGIQLDMSDQKIRKIGAYATTVFQNRLDGVSPIAQKSNTPKYIPPHPARQEPVGDSVSSEQKLEQKNSIGYSDSMATGRLSSIVSIGEQLAQVMISSRPVQIQNNSLLKEKDLIKYESKKQKAEESKQQEEKYKVWKKLYNDFRIDYAEVDVLMKEYPLEDLKSTIIKVSENLEDQETPLESGHMVQMLRKHLNLD